MNEAEIVAQQFRQRPHFSVHAHFLQLRSPKILEGMFEHARHFPGRRGHARDRHDRMAIDLQALCPRDRKQPCCPRSRADRRPRERRPRNLKARMVVASVCGTPQAETFVFTIAGVVASKPLRRNTDGKSSLPPEETWSSATRFVFLLARPLPVTLGLVRIHLAHLLQKIARVRPGNIRGSRPLAVTLLRPPRRRLDWTLCAFRHERIYEILGAKASRARTAAKIAFQAHPRITRRDTLPSRVARDRRIGEPWVQTTEGSPARAQSMSNEIPLRTDDLRAPQDQRPVIPSRGGDDRGISRRDESSRNENPSSHRRPSRASGTAGTPPSSHTPVAITITSTTPLGLPVNCPSANIHRCHDWPGVLSSFGPLSSAFRCMAKLFRLVQATATARPLNSKP